MTFEYPDPSKSAGSVVYHAYELSTRTGLTGALLNFVQSELMRLGALHFVSMFLSQRLPKVCHFLQKFRTMS